MVSFFHSFVSQNDEALAFWLAIHFIAACVFLFGTFYYLCNASAESSRAKEHLPNKTMITSTINHYGPKLGLKSCSTRTKESIFSRRILRIYTRSMREE